MVSACFWCDSQISPTELRGCLGSMNQLTITVGSLAALLINETLTFERWRAAMAMSGIPTLALLLGMAGLCPESPRWLMAQPDSAAKAVEAGNRLWGEGEGELLQVSSQYHCVLEGDAARLHHHLHTKAELI